MFPKNAIYITALPEYVGVLVHYSDMCESKVDKPANQEGGFDKQGVNITKVVGVAVTNDYAVARILITQKEKGLSPLFT
jgi:hypothetical protein